MGFHICEYCHNETSSGDVTLTFANNHVWTMPDMIVHYVEDHGWQPPQAFYDDVMTQTLVASAREQTKGLATAIEIAYLSGPRPDFNATGTVADSFKLRLRQLLEQAASGGNRRQTRGG